VEAICPELFNVHVCVYIFIVCLCDCAYLCVCFISCAYVGVFIYISFVCVVLLVISVISVSIMVCDLTFANVVCWSPTKISIGLK
jgi:hypothetical protein